MARSAQEATQHDEAAPDPQEAQMARFLAMFENRLGQVEESISRRMEERMQATEARLAEQQAELTARQTAGLIAPPSDAQQQTTVDEATRLERAASERMVAFIPKEDPANPRNTLFECWLNGKPYRSNRGEVMMLKIGFALDLARSGHGHVIDMTAMQQIQVPGLPDEALTDKRDGPPVVDPVGQGIASSIPKELLATLGR